MILKNKASTRQPQDILFASEGSAGDARRLQRLAKDGKLVRIAKGIYVPTATAEETVSLVRRNWQRIAAVLLPGAVVSHISALTKGLSTEGFVTLSHPTVFNKSIKLPGVTLVLLKGPGQLPGDLPLGTTGLFWASRPRAILENLGKKAPRRLSREALEQHLVDILNASGEKALNHTRDRAAEIAATLDAEQELDTLQKLVGALLGTHSRGQLRTRGGQLVASGIPVDSERQARFEKLALHLRTVNLPRIEAFAATGLARVHFAFVESYFSNYVEGTKFDIDQAVAIAMRNEIVASRPKDSHDILRVFRLAQTTPYCNAPPPPGDEFLPALQLWHADMLSKRPEANPGELKIDVNYAGTTRFVDPAMVRGTFAECSRLAMSVPEGLARAIFYAFLVSEIHPFDDGNGRLSRLLMNAEMSRMGLGRVIIPTLYHPQYVDCAKQLTRSNEPEGFTRAITKMAHWCAQFDYADLPQLIRNLRMANALEESPIRFKLLNLDGSSET